MIFKGRIFEKPCMDKYHWIGIEEAQVVLFQDFGYNKEPILWGNFLLLLEGETVKIPRAKNHFASDIELDSYNDIPIFATVREIEYSQVSPDYAEEMEMMDSCWNFM